MARNIRKKQVPAYCPVEAGLQDKAKSGVLAEVKNVVAIWFIPIIFVPDDEPSVDIGIVIPTILGVRVAAVPMFISTLISNICPERRRNVGVLTERV
jgi:hypothetical protein